MAAGASLFEGDAKNDPKDGGLTVQAWFDLWHLSHSLTAFGVIGSWPDGGGVTEQPAITVRVFDLVGAEILKEASAASGK